jgi:hypothetical protein
MDAEYYKNRVREAMVRHYEAHNHPAGDLASGRYKPRRVRDPDAPPTEYREQAHVCRWLKARRLLYCHVPSGGKRNPIEGAILRHIGAKAGVPDLLIFTPAPLAPQARGVAVEMKRAKGGTVSDSQREWIKDLCGCGWLAFVARGADEAIKILEGIYGT